MRKLDTASHLFTPSCQIPTTESGSSPTRFPAPGHRPAESGQVRQVVHLDSGVEGYLEGLRSVITAGYRSRDLERLRKVAHVTQVDLALLHEVWDEDIVRENPISLSPKVTDLPLLGWMHRGLVKAILGAVDTTKLGSLVLDYLEDHGSFPGGEPISMEIAGDFAKTARRMSLTDEEQVIDDRLFHRQETGKAASFPGPL